MRIALAFLCSISLLTSSTLAQTLVDFRETIRNVEPALLSVSVKRKQADAGKEPFLPKGQQFQFFDLRNRQLHGNWNFGQFAFPVLDSSNTGFVVADDLVVTYAGGGVDAIEMKDAHGEPIEGKIVLTDNVTGLVVIRLDESLDDKVVIGSAEAEIGTPVVSTSLGREGLMARAGMVASKPIPTSGLGRTPRIDFGSSEPANGSPVVDPSGMVLGVIVPGNGAASSVVRSDVLARLIEAAKAGSTTELKRGFAGIQFGAEGALVMSVNEGSPAADAGVQAGDVVRMVGTASIDTATDVVAVVADYRAGDTIPLSVARDGEEVHLEVTLKEHPQQGFAANPAMGSEPGFWGHGFELKDGKLFPLDLKQQAIPFSGPGVKPIEPAQIPVPPQPPQQNFGPINSFQVERSNVEKALQDLQKQIEKLNEKLDR